jgi:putative transposase
VACASRHLQRQREDQARKLAGTLLASGDWRADEDRQIRNLGKNRHLAKSISDASWARFLWWVEHSARAQGIVAVAVPPQWTSQDCSGCTRRVPKSLSVRTHRCAHCGLLLDRDHNAALTIVRASYQITNRTAG